MCFFFNDCIVPLYFIHLYIFHQSFVVFLLCILLDLKVFYLEECSCTQWCAFYFKFYLFIAGIQVLYINPVSCNLAIMTYQLQKKFFWLILSDFLHRKLCLLRRKMYFFLLSSSKHFFEGITQVLISCNSIFIQSKICFNSLEISI